MADAYNLSTQEIEAGGLPQSQASLGYTVTLSKKDLRDGSALGTKAW